MTIEQAKIEIEQLEPVAEKLWQNLQGFDDLRVKATAEWSEVYNKLNDLKTFVRVSEATCQ